MQISNDAADCRYCSQISKANGEDPIGSAPNVNHWLLVEVKRPWPTSMFREHPIINQVISAVEKLVFRRGEILMPAAIAPDPNYSIPGFTRAIYYRRPAKQFAQYTKQEYVVPDDRIEQLVIALLNRLLGKNYDLTQFANQQDTQHLREMLVCTHTQVDLACGRFGSSIYRQLRQTYGQPDQLLRVWQSTHFGGHQFAPTLIDLPTGQVWGHLDPDSLQQLVERSGDCRQMRYYSRGWTGCSKFEQIADREAWMQEGWDWFAYPRTALTTRKGLTGAKHLLYPLLRWIPSKLLQLWLERWTDDANWVEVKVTYTSPQGEGCYRVLIEENGEVASARSSAATKDQKVALIPVKQYRVGHLVKDV